MIGVVVIMLIRARIFRFCSGDYKNLTELAQAMGISISQIYRVRKGKRSINKKFIIGAIKAFPKRKFEDLFYLALDSPITSDYYCRGLIAGQETSCQKEDAQQ